MNGTNNWQFLILEKEGKREKSVHSNEERILQNPGSGIQKILGQHLAKMGRRTHRRNPIISRGFTLLEVLIVLALIMIVGGIAYGAFQRMAINGNLRTAARDIGSDFALLKQRAMAENIPLTITVDQANKSFTVPQQGGGAVVKQLTNYGVDIFFSKVDFITVTFQPRGTVDQQGDLELSNGRGSTATININSTGRANVRFAMQ